MIITIIKFIKIIKTARFSRRKLKVPANRAIRIRFARPRLTRLQGLALRGQRRLKIPASRAVRITAVKGLPLPARGGLAKNLARLGRLMRRSRRVRWAVTGAMVLLAVTTGWLVYQNLRQAQAVWYHNDWLFRKQLTIDYTKVSGTANLTNFPVLVSLTDTKLAALAQSDADDIMFTSVDGKTKLDHEIEKYTSATGELIAWVEVPTVSYTADTIIYMYYGNPTVLNQENPTGVWDTNYKGVWHLAEDPSISTDGDCGGGTAEGCDSSSNNNDFDSSGSMTSSDQAAGKVNGSLDFDGTNDYISSADSSSLDITDTFTASLWFKPSIAFNGSADYVQGLLDKGAYNMFLDKSDGKLKAEVNNGTITWTYTYNGNADRIGSLATYNGKLYAGQGYDPGDGDILVYDGVTWMISYNGGQEYFLSLAVYNGKLYAGQGIGTGQDGDVYVYDEATWTLSYDGSKYEIPSLTVYNGKLYAGEGSTTASNQGDVLSYDGTVWTTVYDSTQETIKSLAVYNGKLYAAQGNDLGDGDVLSYDGSIWTLSLNGDAYNIFALAVYNGKLYAGQGRTAGEGDVFSYDGTTWTVSYDGSFDRIDSLAVYNGKLYAGQGDNTGEGDVLVYDNTTWTLSYDGSEEEILALAVHNGKLYAGQGVTGSIDGDVFVLNAGGQVASTTTSWDTNWHHAAVAKTGTALTLYIDGTQESTTTLSSATVNTNAFSLFQSKLYGTRGAGTGEGIFGGVVDESRLSSTSRTADWIKTEYNNQNSPSTFFTSESQKSLDKPFAHWKMDEGVDNTCSGGANDVCNNAGFSSLDGAKTGATWQAESMCLDGKCLYFDATADYVQVADNVSLDFDGTDDATITLWFRHKPKTTGTDVLIAKYESTGSDGGYKIWMDGSGDLIFGIDDENSSFPEDSVTSTLGTYDDNKWHHLAAVKTGSTSIKLYLDAKFISQDASLTASNLVNNDPFYIGIDGDGSSNAFQGFIDEVKVFGSARTESQIKTDYVKGASGRGSTAVFGRPHIDILTNGILGFWKMDETTADSCSGGADSCDSSGNNRHGTWSGNPTPGVIGKFRHGLSFDGTGDYVDVGDIDL